MSTTLKALFNSKYASDTIAADAGIEYRAPNGRSTIIDKFTATNTDGSTQTISVHLVPAGGIAEDSNLVTSEFSLAAGESKDLPELKGHVLNASDFIACVASLADKVVIRASGRELE